MFLRNVSLFSRPLRAAVSQRCMAEEAAADRVRPHRSVLYMPGSNLKAIVKARTLPADVIIMDLEDAVAPDAKVQARKQIMEALGQGFGDRHVVIRANGLDTPWGDEDLRTLATAPGIVGIAIPKVEKGETLVAIHKILSGSKAPPSLELWGMIETPKGVLRVNEVCEAGTSEAAGRRLSALVLSISPVASAFPRGT